MRRGRVFLAWVWGLLINSVALAWRRHRSTHLRPYRPGDACLPDDNGNGTTSPLAGVLAAEQHRWFLWVPVFFGTGIGAYFWLPIEPNVAPVIVLLVAVVILRLTFRQGTVLPAATGIVICLASGFLCAKARTEWVRAPVLEAPVTARMAAGFIEAMEPRQKKGMRITLRLRALQGVADDQQPERIRFNWNGDTDLEVGDAITVRVSLRPPPTPVRPGGYDFARRAWFKRIGGVGFAVAEPVRARDLPRRPDFLGLRSWIGDARQQVARKVEAVVPGSSGAIINALIIGQRGKVPEEKLEHLRRSGLSHMLAISGLHMAMIAGALFWLLRGGLAAVPALALNHRIKKAAAVVALFGGIGYLAVSGASVATQRAAIMIGLMLVAILLDRPAISLRNVAIAALVILIVAPENILEIGFQMSFAAVVALVAFYEWWQVRQAQRDEIHGRLIQNPILLMALRGSRNMVVGTAATTMVAGLAVAPFAAFHFHKIAQFSLLANMLAMPVFTVVVMPMALVTLISAPFGLESGGLKIMAWGIEQVTGVAAWIAGKPNAVRATASMPPLAFLSMVFGGLWLCLWERRWRFAGLLPIVVGVVLASQSVPPDLLVAREGHLVAARTNGVQLSGSPGRLGRFELARWLQADGDLRDAESIVRGDGFTCDSAGCTARLRGVLIAMPRSPANLVDDCRRAAIVIQTFDQVRPCPSARLVIDRQALKRDGVHAITIGDGGDIQLVTVEALRGARPWTRKGRMHPDDDSLATATH